MTLQPDIDLTEGLQNKCCKENLEFYSGGDGVEWEMWECDKCKLKYVVPIEIQRYFDDASLIINQEEE